MKKIIIILVLVIVGILVLVISTKKSDAPQVSDSKQKLRPQETITHGHGLAMDPNDSSKLYIATHHGLLLLENDKDLYQVGTATDDYMGFSPHPTDGKVFFSSGHPAAGGNIGFQKSEDGALSWHKVSNGLGGPVDFHAMTVSLANHNLVYGSYHGAVQRSMDQGKTWEKFPVNFVIVNFAADPSDENIIYAASPQGLFVSKDKAQTWTELLDPAKGGFISSVSIDPQNSKNLLVYSEKMGLIRSGDSGITWIEVKADFAGETPLYIVFAKNVINIGYILTEKNSIYKSTDNGLTWKKIR